jgi:uncharacterized protein YndB with AHSA1/START domain
MRYMNQVVQAERKSKATPEQVFTLLGDVASWASWSSFDESALERPGLSTPDGVGAIRAFRYKRTRSREEVTAYEPPHRLGYRLLEGVPVKEYTSEVTLTPIDSGGTLITWRSTFRPAWPGSGWLFRRLMTRFIGLVAGELASAAERSG